MSVPSVPEDQGKASMLLVPLRDGLHELLVLTAAIRGAMNHGEVRA